MNDKFDASKYDIEFETEQLLDYYVEKLSESNSVTEVYELNWYVRDRVLSTWNGMFDNVIQVIKEQQKNQNNS